MSCSQYDNESVGYFILAIRKEYTRRAKAHSAEWKERMTDMQDALLEKEDTQRAVSSEMTRQYKTMQTHMILRTHTLERELQLTRNELGVLLSV